MKTKQLQKRSTAAAVLTLIVTTMPASAQTMTNAAIGFKKGRILPPRLADSYLALLIEGIYYSICLNAE